MGNPLLDKLKKSGTVDAASVLKNSIFYSSKESITTEVPILNVAFSGKLDGGISSGLTVIAGESRCYKTLLSLYCAKAYLDKYEDAVLMFYDSEFGTPESYMSSIGIDTERVLHIPIQDLEELTFDLTQRLDSINRGDKVFIMVDSVGNLASKREVENAMKENSAKDMSRAAAVKSLFRIITPRISMKDIPCVVIAHTYQDMGSFISKSVISGGTGLYYAANTMFIITKAQEKDGDELVGWNYTISIEKSRFVKERSKLKFQVLWNNINKYAGLLDLAEESGCVIIPAKGWYSKVNTETGEVEDKKYRKKDLDSSFWEPIINSKRFKDFVSSKYMLGYKSETVEEPVTDIEE